MTSEPPSRQPGGGVIDPDELGDHQGLGVEGPPEWPFAQVKDWIALALDIPHVDVRVYAVFRSLATRWQMNRRLTKDQVRWLVPGVNGKPMAPTAFKDSLRRLSERGLVLAKRGSTNVRQVRNATTGKFEAVEELLWRVNELPIEGDSYIGPRSVFDALDAYPGPGWTVEDRQSIDGSYAASDRGRISGHGNVRCDLEKRSVSAGETERGSGRKSDGRGRKSGRENAVTSGNAAHHTGLPNVLPDRTTSSYSSTDSGTARRGETQEEAGKASPPTSTTEPGADAYRTVDAAWPTDRPRTARQRTQLAVPAQACLDAGHSVEQVGETIRASIPGARAPVGVAIRNLRALAETPPAPAAPAAVTPVSDWARKHAHVWTDDGRGGCSRCPLPEMHPVHRAAGDGVVETSA